jgi:hypothetical protein
MTTKSPLIRRLGNGYCASGDGFYLFDEDLQRILARVAELSQSAIPEQQASQRARRERRKQDRAGTKSERATSE